MSNPGEADATPIRSARQLAEHIAAGCKSREAWRIGTEHEKFGFRRPAQGEGPGGAGSGAAYRPPGYAPDGIRAMLDGIAARGWAPISDAGAVIGLGRGGASVSLEPAGQLELSGAPLATLHETRAELGAHFEDVRAIARPLGLGFAPLGFHPTGAREAMPWMPKSRYAIMRRYMQRTGTRGLDMMLRTCTVQVNLDYGGEADMVRKLRVGLLLQPVATALFANSPFTEGRPNGFLSARANVWLDTDAERTGIPAAVFEEGFGFERYVEWLLDVPMYFVMRQGAYVDLAGRSFRDFMAGRLSGEVEGAATVGDFADHMTTAFTEVRLKRFLEMRGADAGTPEMMLAQSALWVGLLYDDAALSAAVSLVGRHPWRDFAALREHVPRQGLGAAWGAGTLRDVARDVVAIAAGGLRARGLGEEALLAPLHAIVAGGPTQAEHWLARYHGAWGGDVRRVFDEAEI
jgi:glutamate--cysteine ligase